MGTIVQPNSDNFITAAALWGHPAGLLLWEVAHLMEVHGQGSPCSMRAASKESEESEQVIKTPSETEIA